MGELVGARGRKYLATAIGVEARELVRRVWT